MGKSDIWHLWVDQTPRPGYANMAIDLALLDRAEHSGESWLRLYTWEPHCLSFGRHEPSLHRYDADRITARGIDTVRRPTGGRAVWHSKELTYAVAAPCQSFGSLAEAYLEIHQMLADALGSAGFDVSLAPPRRAQALDAGACFAHPAGGEVMNQGRKLVGSAQLRGRRALLQHGSILLEDEQQMVAAFTREQPLNSLPPPDILSRGIPPTWRMDLSVAELSEAIADTSSLRWPGAWHRISGSDEVIRAASWYYPQFRSPAWTWER